jgi:hypothetical protein
MAAIEVPPSLNQHGRALMEELGLSEDDIEEVMGLSSNTAGPKA